MIYFIIYLILIPITYYVIRYILKEKYWTWDAVGYTFIGALFNPIILSFIILRLLNKYLKKLFDNDPPKWL